MTSEETQKLLAEFQAWLDAQPTRLNLPEPTIPPTPPIEPIPVIDVLNLFIGLRHEVNLLTKSTRGVLEQNRALLDEWTTRPATASEPPTPPADPDALRMPLFKVLLDVADALARAGKELAKTRHQLELLFPQHPLLKLPATPTERTPTDHRNTASGAYSPGWWQRWFSRPSKADPSASEAGTLQAWQIWAEQIRNLAAQHETERLQAMERASQFLAGLTDGYAMSLRRIERVLTQFEFEALPVVGMPFDAETMEAVEVVPRPSGMNAEQVVEEVRTGYRRHGKLFRYAWVKVCR